MESQKLSSNTLEHKLSRPIDLAPKHGIACARVAGHEVRGILQFIFFFDVFYSFIHFFPISDHLSIYSSEPVNYLQRFDSSVKSEIF